MVQKVKVYGIAEEWLKTQEVIQDRQIRRGDYDDLFLIEMKRKPKKRERQKDK